MASAWSRMASALTGVAGFHPGEAALAMTSSASAVAVPSMIRRRGLRGVRVPRRAALVCAHLLDHEHPAFAVRCSNLKANGADAYGAHFVEAITAGGNKDSFHLKLLAGCRRMPIRA